MPPSSRACGCGMNRYSGSATASVATAKTAPPPPSRAACGPSSSSGCAATRRLRSSAWSAVSRPRATKVNQARQGRNSAERLADAANSTVASAAPSSNHRCWRFCAISSRAACPENSKASTAGTRSACSRCTRNSSRPKAAAALPACSTAFAGFLPRRSTARSCQQAANTRDQNRNAASPPAASRSVLQRAAAAAISSHSGRAP